MKRSVQTLFALFMLALIFTACEEENNENEVSLGDKSGILLVTFGSSYEAPWDTYDEINSAFSKNFTDSICWGFTSDQILNKLRQGNGEGSLNGVVIDKDSPEEALKLMVEDGYSKFSIQSLHIIPGEEYDELLETVEEFEADYPDVEIAVGAPLLSSDEDLVDVANIMAEVFADEAAQGPVVFMGHGTPEHVNDKKYALLDSVFGTINSNFIVGTVEGAITIDDVLEDVAALNLTSKTVTLTPLMSIAGDHANNDMNGTTDATDESEQSWRERFESEGYTVTSVMKGLGDYEEIREIWINHLEAAEQE